MKVINLRAVAVTRHGKGLLEWTKDKLRTIYKKAKKAMITHEVLYSQGDVDRLYIPHNNVGRGMIKVEDFVEIEKRRA